MDAISTAVQGNPGATGVILAIVLGLVIWKVLDSKRKKSGGNNSGRPKPGQTPKQPL